jgi:FixJ family two-component response regulator
MVLVVDDDASALNAIARLIRLAGFKVRTFSHPKALLNEQLPSRNAYLVADIYLPEMNGVELCHTLAVPGCALPTVLIMGRNDEVTGGWWRNQKRLRCCLSRLTKPLYSRRSRDV